MDATGGTLPYHWSIAAGGNLPDGLNINPDTGLISGTPTTAGTFGFTVQVTDSSQIIATKRFTFAGPPSPGTGGGDYEQPIVLPPPPGSPTPDQPADCLSGSYALADGSTLPDGLTLDPNTGVISGTPTDGGTYSFTVQCTTVTNEVAQGDFTITIYNPAPTLTSLDPSSADEGGPDLTLHVLGSGFVASSTVLWNGNPLTTTYVSPSELDAAVPAADIVSVGTASVSVTNPDLNGDGGTSNSLTFTINNVAPQVDTPVVSTSPSNEGDSVTASASFVDPGNDGPYSCTVDYGDGSGPQNGDISGSTCTGPSHPYADNGEYTVTVAVTDANSDTGSNSVSQTVNNVAPTATLGNDGPVNERSAATISFTDPTDPSSVDTTTGFHYAFSCDNGSLDGATYANSSADASTTCTFDDGPSTHIVKGRIIDKDGGYTERTTTVTVENVAPTATLTAPTSVNEGDHFTVSLDNPFDPSQRIPRWVHLHLRLWRWRTGPQDTGTTASISCVAHDVTSQTVAATITDKDGGSNSYTADVTVNNVAPTVGPITAPVDPVQAGTSIDASASFTDPGIGLGDSFTATWDWGDGTTNTDGVVSADSSPGSVTGSHTYTAAGVYTITLTVTDKDGDSGSSTYQYVVVYDPSAGFVTGGGWFNSPAGAYAADPSLSGKATFGFVAKYQKGKTTPDGNTEFQFKAGNLNFSSTSYDWLVISGTKAQFKGTGTINGQGQYRFMLTAVDGSSKGNDDTFRIRIWAINTDGSDGGLVYDNQVNGNQSDTADPTTTLGGGNIVIHN